MLLNERTGLMKSRSFNNYGIFLFINDLRRFSGRDFYENGR